LRPDPVLGGEDVTVLEAGSGEGYFEVTPQNLLAGKKYYYRAYAVNEEGLDYGTQEEESRVPSWAGAASAEADGWWASPWFGNFYLVVNNWLWHESLGWLYAVGDGTGGVWLWQENLGWSWTDDGVFPYLYLNDDSSWHYLLGEVVGRLFLYRFRDGEWLEVAKGAESK
jgi:hypothetical protein